MIAQQRCSIHDSREAAARCPVCRNVYCRECVTEHEGRVVCAGCLAKMSRPRASTPRRLLLRVAALLLPVLGLLLAWLVFYGVGRALMLMPSSVHDGSLWSRRSMSGAWVGPSDGRPRKTMACPAFDGAPRKTMDCPREPAA